jgi:transcriptional regulator with XRE-family HTH domain
MVSPIKPARLRSLPETMRHNLKEARLSRAWSQVELGRRVGLPQMHISGIEIGKIVPRFNTLLDLVRVLDFDLVLVPRVLVPAVQSLIRDQRNPEDSRHADDGEQPLYATAVGGQSEISRDEI